MPIFYLPFIKNYYPRLKAQFAVLPFFPLISKHPVTPEKSSPCSGQLKLYRRLI